MKFKIGDRVQDITRGKGTIKCISDIQIGVEYDNNINGHSLRSGNCECKSGYGWWCLENELELLDDEKEILDDEKEILDEVEKRYLRNVIKYVIEPTHNEIKSVYKYKYLDGDMAICFDFDNDNGLNLPFYNDKRMYKVMELDKKYTLEELGL